MSKAKTKARYIVTLGEMGTDEILDTQTHREFCGSSEDMVNQLLAELNRLNKEEIGSLKAELDRLRVFQTKTIVPNKILQTENASLKAEVEQLQGLLSAATFYKKGEAQ